MAEGGTANGSGSQGASVEVSSQEKIFVDYLSDEEIQDGLKKTGDDEGRIWSGEIRVNRKNYTQSFVSDPNGGVDILFPSIEARNRALDGDIVAYNFYPEALFRSVERQLENLHMTDSTTQSADGAVTLVQKIAKVVGIVQPRHTRRAIACISSYDKESGMARLSPTDSRIPRVVVPLEQCPADLTTSFTQYQNMMFAVEIEDWPVTSQMAIGTIMTCLGARGVLANETEAILEYYCINRSEFSAEVLACLPGEDFLISDSELSRRRDLREEVVFTIDPDTARDMDDAIHCKALDDGNMEVGVHIADVTHFMKSGSALDDEAAQRCTSTYLVNRVIPMLPHRLSNDLCSLRAREDRLAVSVVWSIAEDGSIVSTWMGRSVIHSRAKLSYRVAQEVLDDLEKDWSAEYLKTDVSSVQPIVIALSQLSSITAKLRQRRAEKGFLSIRNNERLEFAMDDQSDPIGCQASNQYGTQKLIEELMLLANISVAGKIHKSAREEAVLRRHASPHGVKLAEVETFSQRVDMLVDCSSVKTVQESLSRVLEEHGEVARLVICQRLLQAFRPAEYYTLADERISRGFSLPHYALNEVLYTHFTSPIRRYADVLVHRQLLLSLDGVDSADMSSDKEKQELVDVVARCNDMRLKAKKAGADSNSIYFAAFVRHSKSLVADALVIDILDRSFDVMLLSYVGVFRVHCNSLPLGSFKHDAHVPSLSLVWMPEKQEKGGAHAVQQCIKPFSQVKVVIRTEDRQGNPLALAVYLQAPPGCSSQYGLPPASANQPARNKKGKRH